MLKSNFLTLGAIDAQTQQGNNIYGELYGFAHSDSKNCSRCRLPKKRVSTVRSRPPNTISRAHFDTIPPGLGRQTHDRMVRSA